MNTKAQTKSSSLTFRWIIAEYNVWRRRGYRAEIAWHLAKQSYQLLWAL